MKKRRFTLLSSLAILSLGLVATGVSAAQNNVSVVMVQADSVSNYYSDITDSMSGTTLRNALNALNTKKRTSTVGYGGMRSFAAKCDADPDGSGKILSFYDNELVGPDWDGGSTWNREHVWPNVRGGSKVEDDAHMTRPCSTKTNSDRGSKGYGATSYDPGKYVAYYRGAASRIILYAAIADLSLNLVDDPLNYHGAGSYPDSMGSLSEMLAWNLQYQPQDTSFTGANDIARRAELNRNNVIQNDKDGQGNRNPFIDHPEYACRIWGNTNDATRKACSGAVIPPDTPVDEDIKAETLTVTKESLTLKVGETYQLYAEYTPSNVNKMELAWYTSEPGVASVDEYGLITAKAAGSSIITVFDSVTNLAANCELTVVASGGCGGNIMTTSIVLTLISAIGIGLLLIKRKVEF